MLSACTVPVANPLPDLYHQANTPLGRMIKHVSPTWTAPIVPAGRTAMTDDTLVALDVKEGGRLEAVALDLTNGAERWRRPAGAGAPVPSTRLDAVVVKTPEGNAVTAFFAPTQGQKVTLVLADPRTGEQREVETPGLTALTTCKVVGGLCAEQVEGNHRVPVRIDPVSGKVTKFQLKQGPLDRVSDLGDGVYIARRDGRTVLGRAGSEGWEKPLSTWFGTDVELPATLSWTSHDADANTVSISLRKKPLTDADLRIPVSEIESVIVETGTGESVWDARGKSLWCPGSGGVVCSGDLTYTRPNKNTRTFVPAAGQTTYAGLPTAGGTGEWSYKLPAVATATGPDRTVLKVPSEVWVFKQGDRVQMADLLGGELTTLDETHWMACASSRPIQIGQTKATAWDYRPCTARAVAEEPAQFTIAGVVSAATQIPRAERPPEIPGYYAVTMPGRIALFR
ncbi:hypothetical protein GCM10027418_02840 [Mariniluteicoccus endophyticus]